MPVLGYHRAVAQAPDTWQVLPSGPIERLEDNLWRVEGELERGPIRRVMTVARMDDGRLVIHNGIALPEPGMAELETFGTPAFLVVPNGYHRLDAARYKARYPDLTVLCPVGSRKRVAKLVAVDGDYDDFAQQPEVRLEHLEGTGDGEGTMIVRSASGATIVLNDIVFNMPHRSGLGGLALRYLTASTGGPKISRIARMFFVKDAAALRGHLQRLAKTPDLKRLIVSHHETLETGAAQALEEVAASL